jgi:PHD/YefM family antitoxin component YafN of YafNO toxin-antitoxin module
MQTFEQWLEKNSVEISQTIAGNRVAWMRKSWNARQSEIDAQAERIKELEADLSSAMATVEILSNSEIVRELSQGLRDVSEGKTISLDDLRAKLRLPALGGKRETD